MPNANTIIPTFSPALMYNSSTSIASFN